MARMERLAANMPHSTIKAFRRYAQVHDVDLCVAAKTAVTDCCRMTPNENDLMSSRGANQERIWISMPDTAMRLLELWAENTGIPKVKLMEWAIRQMVKNQNQNLLEEEIEV